MKILVTGATGYIGGRIIPELVALGHDVRVLVRDPRRIVGRPWADDVGVAVGDVEDPSTLPEALDGIEVAYYLVHLMDSGRDFVARDRRAALNFAAAARGVRRIIYLGGLLPDSEHISPHLASRAEVGSILRDRLPTLEFRAGPVVGSGSASFEMARYLTERLPAMIAPKWILNPVQPIAVDDVVAYLIAGVDRGKEGVYSIGSQPLTFKGMMTEYAAVRGLRRLIVPVPVLAPKLAALWVGLVTPIPNRLAVPLIEGVVHPVTADTSDALRDFPEIQPLPYRESVRRALESIESEAVPTRWSGALGAAQAVELTTREGLVRETRRHHTSAQPEDVFEVVTSLGGDRGWLYWDWAWSIRGAFDRLLGGPGLRRGRRHPSEILAGDAVDFWRVEAVTAPRQLRLRAEMKVPGSAWLQWDIEPEGAGACIVQTALFAPVGLTGTLYWNVLYPVHKIIFAGMLRSIAREAETRATT